MAAGVSPGFSGSGAPQSRPKESLRFGVVDAGITRQTIGKHAHVGSPARIGVVGERDEAGAFAFGRARFRECGESREASSLQAGAEEHDEVVFPAERVTKRAGLGRRSVCGRRAGPQCGGFLAGVHGTNISARRSHLGFCESTT